MFSHDRIWAAIDAVAAHHGLTASGLAKRAGLDPTAFNKSKRVGGGGRLRWPTTESLSKILGATGTTPEEFTAYLVLGDRSAARLPALVPAAPGFLEGGAVEAAIRRSADPASATLIYRVPDDRLEPIYRRGDRLLLDLSAAIAPGHRVVLVDRAGEVRIGEVLRWGEDVRLAKPGDGGNSPLRRGDIAFAARIIWASQ